MYTGPNNLADLGEFTITEEDFRPKQMQRIQLQDWLANFSRAGGRPEVSLDHQNKRVYIGHPKPTDCDIYYEVWGQPWEIIWAQD